MTIEEEIAHLEDSLAAAKKKRDEGAAAKKARVDALGVLVTRGV